MTFGLSAGAIGLIGAGAAVAGGAIAASGSKSAANTQANAENQANETNKQIFDKQVQLQEPFRQRGIAAGNRLDYLLGLPTAAPAQTSAPPQVLQPGPDGVFAPRAELPPMPAPPQAPAGSDPVTQAYYKYLGRAPDPEGLAYYQRMAATMGMGAVEADISGSGEAAQFTQRSAQQQQAAQQQQQAPQPRSTAPVLNASGQPAQFGEFGSLARDFSQQDYQNDPFPKVPAFTQTPNLPTFNEQAPQVPTLAQKSAAPTLANFQGRPDMAQMGDAAQLQDFQSRPELAGFQGRPELQDFQGRPDLSGFEDLPAFTAAQMQDDPGYQFRLQEGLKAQQRSAAARGGLLSGATLKAAERYGQDYASNEYGNSFNRYQTTRGNKLQTYLTNRDTSGINRTNALQDYLTNQGTAQTNRGNAVQDYTLNRDTAQANRANAVADYGLNRDTAQLNRGNQVQTYTVNRDTQDRNRANALSDYTTNRQTDQQNIDNTARDFTTNMGVQQQNYTNQRGAFDTNFNQYQVGRTNAVNDWKDAFSQYQANRANANQDYAGAYDRFQTNRSNIINPLLSLMGAGQQATNQTSGAAQNFGQQSVAATTAAGNARAAGQVGSANAINGAFGSVVNQYQQNQLMNRMFPPKGTSPTTAGAGYDPWQTSGSGMPSWYTGD